MARLHVSPLSIHNPSLKNPQVLAGWLPCWERASHLAVECVVRKMFCGVLFPPHGVYDGN